MPPAPIDLTDIAAVRELLQDSESIPDETVQVMITAASRAILNHTQRELIKGGEEARDFLSRGSHLDLGSKDLRGKPTAVTLYTDLEEAEQIDLEPSEYKVRPIPPEFGVYEWLELPEDLTGEVQVTVKGNWGFEVIPEDVAYWCGMTVVIWSRSDISAFSTTYNVDEGRVERPEDLPPAVKHALNHYRRLTVG